MNDKANLTLTLAGKDGSAFVVDGLQSIYAHVQQLHSSDVALLEFTVVIPRYQVQEGLRTLAQNATEFTFDGPARSEAH
ncbi:MAG TPA: hypothetical protein VKT29_12015 [Terriglobales bacterium]|nr:hypothetical protein [Terriglobales bacterium]